MKNPPEKRETTRKYEFLVYQNKSTMAFTVAFLVFTNKNEMGERERELK